MRKLLKLLGLIFAMIVVAVGGMLSWLTAEEYKPEPVEALTVTAAPDGTTPQTLDGQTPVRILTWNVGYGALGDNADFFMDGGEGVMTADEPRVNENLKNMASFLNEQTPDLIFLQEVDRSSKRSYKIDEIQMFQESMKDGYQATFANNYLVPFVPFPIPPLGKIDSGILTLSKYQISDATRISLPCPFSWPVRTANLKRCLMTDRIPVAGTDKELVMINLHLEAYDSGEGKIAQTNTLLEFMNKERAKGNYVIAGGDFNQRFDNVDSSAYPVLENKWQPGSFESKHLGEGWSVIMDPKVPTCRSLDTPLDNKTTAEKDPAAFQYYMIDGFIVSDNIQVVKIKTHDLSFVSSDHNPVLMEVTLK